MIVLVEMFCVINQITLPYLIYSKQFAEFEISSVSVGASNPKIFD